MRISDWSSDVCSSDLLVDENLTRARFLGLRHQEIDDDRLAAPGRANDQRVANVALVKAEEVGAACARLHQRDRVPPMVPRGEASGIGMEGRERREVQRRDRRRPRAPCEISDELAPVAASSAAPSRAATMPVSASAARAIDM